MADQPPGARPPDDENVDVESRLAGALVPATAGHRPLTLSEALYERIIEVTRQEVSTAVEVLGSVVAQVGRLERRINALFEMVDQKAPPAPGGGAAAAGAIAGDLRDQLARLERRIEENGTSAAGAAGRLNGLVAQLREEIENVAQRAAPAADGGLADSVARELADLRRVVEETRARGGDGAGELVPPPAPPFVDLAPLESRLAAIEDGLAQVRLLAGGPPDLAAVTEGLAALRAQLDQVRSELADATQEVGPVQQALAELHRGIERAGEGRDAAVSAVTERIETLQRGLLEELRQATAGMPQVDLAPVTEAVDAVGRDLAELRAGLDALRPDLSPLHDEVTALRHALAERGDDGLAEAVAAVGRDLNELRGELAQAAPDLSPLQTEVAGLRGVLAEQRDDVLAAVDQARAAAGSPDLSSITDRLAELRSAIATAGTNLAPVEEQLAALREAVDATHAAVAAPPDLTPVLDALDRLQVGVADARPDLAPIGERLDQLHQAIGEVREAAAVPPDLTALTQALADLRTAIAEDHEGVVAQVELLMRPVAPLTDAAEASRTALDGLTAQQGEQVAELARLREAQEAEAARAREQLAEVEATTRRLLESSEPVAGKVEQLTRVVDDLARQAVATRTQVERFDPAAWQQELGGRIDALHALLAAASLEDQDGRLREMRTVLAALVGEIVSLRESQDTERVTAPVVEAVQGAAGEATRQMAQQAREVQAALDRSRQETTARVSVLEESLSERLQALDARVAQVSEELAAGGAQRDQLAVLHGLREAVEGVARVVAEAKTAAEAAAPAAELTRAVNVITEVRWDMESTQERVLEVDRKIGGLRSDMADTARMAHAGYQAAEAVAAGLSAVARLERRLDVELDGMGRQLDALAAAVELSVQHRDERGESRAAERLAAQVGDRVRRYRELAADVREAVREDMRRRRALKDRERFGTNELGSPAGDGDGASGVPR